MPTIQIPVYVPEKKLEDFVKNSEMLKEKTKDFFKEQLNKVSEDDEE